jgi:putative oxidoreductase
VRRLFSTFATGVPGAGLLVMRAAAASALLLRGIAGLSADPTLGVAALLLFQIVLGALLFAGLWTPLAGALVAVLEVARLATAQPGDPWSHILLGTLGLSLALLGPGAWSADARLFGWRRIDIPDRTPRASAPRDR